MLFAICIFLPQGLYAQNPSPKPGVKPEVTDWQLVRQKVFPHYRVEILQRWAKGKFPRIESQKARIVPLQGGTVTEITGTWLTPDPKDFLKDWQPGRPLDITGDGLEDLFLRVSSGGVHCCYRYVIFSLEPVLKRLADLEMRDCGDSIQLKDLNGDGKPEILSCDAKFVYLGDLPYDQSPFPPAVYSLGATGYERADKNFPQIYSEDIQKQQQALAQGSTPFVVLQIVTDYFLLGDEKKGWEEFEKLYQGTDKDKIRLQLTERLQGKIPEPEIVIPAPKSPETAPSPGFPPGGN